MNHILRNNLWSLIVLLMMLLAPATAHAFTARNSTASITAVETTNAGLEYTINFYLFNYDGDNANFQGDLYLTVNGTNVLNLRNMWSGISSTSSANASAESQFKGSDNNISGNIGSQGTFSINGVSGCTAQLYNLRNEQNYNSQNKWSQISLKIVSRSYYGHTIGISGTWRDRCDKWNQGGNTYKPDFAVSWDFVIDGYIRPASIYWEEYAANPTKQIVVGYNAEGYTSDASTNVTILNYRNGSYNTCTINYFRILDWFPCGSGSRDYQIVLRPNAATSCNLDCLDKSPQLTVNREHKWSSYQHHRNADCSHDGTMHHVCTRCKQMDTIPDPDYPRWTYSVSTPGAGIAGTVSGSLSSSGCTYTVTATPKTGYQFLRWSNGSTSNPQAVSMSGNTALVGYFSTTVTVNNQNPDCGTVTGAGTYECFSSVTLTATPNTGYHTVWPDNSQNATYTISQLSSPRTVDVQFVPNNYNIYAQAAGSDGTVSGSGTYPYGSTITLTATPSDGFVFSQWSDGSTDNPREVTVTETAYYTGHFVRANIDIVEDLTRPTSATIAWALPNEGAEQYRVVVTSGTDTLLNTLTTDTFCLVSGLEPATAYTLRVAISSIDNGGVESMPARANLALQTLCSTITEYPWSEDFEGMADGEDISDICWTNRHISGTGTLLFKVSDISTGRNSTHQAYLPSMDDGTITRLGLPLMDFGEPNSYVLTIDVYRNSPYAATEGLRIFAGDQELGFISRCYLKADGARVPAESTTGWYTYEFLIPVGGEQRITIQGENDYNYATFFDNIVVRQIPSCPSVTDIHTIKRLTTTSSATIAWDNTGAEQYRVVVKNSSNTLVDTLTTDTFCLVSGLEPATEYQLYTSVRAICGDNDESLLRSTLLSFQTRCNAITSLPWSEGFEAYYPGTKNNPNLPCWDFINCYLGNAYPHVYVDGNTIFRHSGSRTFVIFAGANREAIAILPEFAVDLSQAKISFWYRNEGVTLREGYTSIGYVTDIADSASFVSLQTLARTESFLQAEQSLASVPEGARIAIRYVGGVDGYVLGIDDIVIEEDPNAPTDWADHRAEIVTASGVEVSMGRGTYYPWVTTTSDVAEGLYMPGLMSSNCAQYETESIDTIHFASDYDFTLSFNWAVSSTTWYDNLSIWVDEDIVVDHMPSFGSANGEGTYSETLAGGRHSLVVNYSKDYTTQRGLDRGFIYNISAIADTSSQPTALPAAAASDALRAEKRIINGHIIIVLPDGTTFDATGRRM